MSNVMFDSFDMERVLVYAHTLLAEYPALAKNSKFDIRQTAAEQLVMTMKSWMLSGRIDSRQEVETIQIPQTPWDMFKERHMPYWFNRWFPVRYTLRTVKIVTHHYFVCPHLNADEKLDHLGFMATGTPQTGRMR